MEELAKPRDAHVGLSNDAFVHESGNWRASIRKCGKRVMIDGILDEPFCQRIQVVTKLVSTTVHDCDDVVVLDVGEEYHVSATDSSVGAGVPFLTHEDESHGIDCVFL